MFRTICYISLERLCTYVNNLTCRSSFSNFFRLTILSCLSLISFKSVAEKISMKTAIVAEVGSNWEGSIKKATKLISKCKDAGADAVKFQMWRATDLYNMDHPDGIL